MMLRNQILLVYKEKLLVSKRDLEKLNVRGKFLFKFRVA